MAAPLPDAGGPSWVEPVGALFMRVIFSLKLSLKFDHAQLVVIADRANTVVFRDGSSNATTSPGVRTQCSPKLWPGAHEPVRVIRDATSELDPAFEADRALVAAGAGSIIVIPLHGETQSVGILILTSAEAGAFEPSMATILVPACEFLSVAVDHERRWAGEQLRHARRVRLEVMLPKIAESLDVRKVFAELSGLIREVIPHDIMTFALLLPDRTGVSVQAATEQGVMELPPYHFSNPDEPLDVNMDFLLGYDVQPVDESTLRTRISPLSAPELKERVTKPGARWVKFITDAKIHSVLRVPIRSSEGPIGGIAFMSRSADQFDEEDGIVASRVADQLALALAHEKLAEEERQIALAEERAQMLQMRVDQLSRELDRFTAHRAIGQSAAWKHALADATKVAGTDTTVLITGESGTGKEVIARFIHRGSKRAKGPFVALNCAALPEQLLESELFGHERGAFTGAVEARAGKIEQAAGGVLFLDEVGEMSPTVQAKFLRVLQEREFQRVGGTRTLKADVRIVAATNRDPRAAIAAGAFREDLYYRLGVFEIHLPPLRERPDDILVLAEAFLEEVGASVGRPAAGISEDAREQLLVHRWPGNVRELRNAIERAVILCQGGLLTREHLPITVSRPSEERVAMATSATAEFPVEGVPLESVERDLLVKAMAKAGNNKSKAAKLLGVTRGQLYSLLRRHGLTDARR